MQFQSDDRVAVACATEIGHGSEDEKDKHEQAKIGQRKGMWPPPPGDRFAVHHAVRGHGAT